MPEQRPGERHPLLHSVRERVHRPLHMVCETYLLERANGLHSRSVARETLQPAEEDQVLERRDAKVE